MAGKSTKSDKPDKPEEKKPYTIIDVNHPGTTAADAAGKPVIVTNRPILKDPMVVEGEESIAEEGEAVPVTRTKKIKIEPIEHGDDAAAPAEKTPAAKDKDSKKTVAELAVEADAKGKETEAKAKPEAKPEPAAEPEPEPEAKSEPATEAPAEEAKPEPAGEEPAAGDDQAPVDEVLKSDEEDPKAAEAARKEAERQLALNKLAESGTYSLPINAVEKRRVRRVALIVTVLLLVLGLVWADLALDAQLIQIDGVKAPPDFFPDR